MSTRSMNFTTPALACALTIISGCELFPNDDEGSFYDEIGGTDDDDTPPDPPSEGFRVFPKYLLQDVPAIVTIDGPDLDPAQCFLDPLDEGGYLCDTDELPGPTTTVYIERDGFEPTTRELELPSSLIDVEVHLSPEGGPTGTWSECVASDAFVTCEDVCTQAGLPCAPASCATEDPLSPIASSQAFATLECVDAPTSSLVLSCEAGLPAADELNVGLRCCCAG